MLYKRAHFKNFVIYLRWKNRTHQFSLEGAVEFSVLFICYAI